MKLRELAHSRAGDKGAIVNLSVIAFEPQMFSHLEREVTAARVAQHFAGIAQGDVVRYVLPHLRALNFVLRRAPRDEVTRSLALDAHGKSLSSALLDLEIPEPEPRKPLHAL